MKTFLKTGAFLLVLSLAAMQTSAQSSSKQTSQKEEKPASKKSSKIDNKIAVSDNTPTADKGTKTNATKKNKGASNK